MCCFLTQFIGSLLGTAEQGYFLGKEGNEKKLGVLCIDLGTVWERLHGWRAVLQKANWKQEKSMNGR